MEQLTDENFKTKINEGQKNLVLFSADWCGPCKIVKPIVENIKEEMGEDFSFYLVDVNQSEETTSNYKVKNIPTGLILIDGEEKGRFTGAKKEEDIKNLINNFLN
jgi:thioredoxin 1